jgi:hypothetical protein
MMTWKFDTIQPTRPALTAHTMTIEGHSLAWVKKLAVDRRSRPVTVIRELLAQAVAYWCQEGRTRGFCWGTGSTVEANTKVFVVLLDDATLRGLREIMTASGKSLSRVTSEILLDAMVAETEAMQADLLHKKTA